MWRKTPAFGGLLGTLLIPGCVPTLCGCTPPVPLAILAVEGPTLGLSGIAGTELPGLITAAVRFSDGTGVAGVEVTFTVDVPGATATPASATTDATGRARTTWRLGSTIGQQRLTISVKPGGGFYIANPPVTVVALAEAAPS